MQGLKRFATVLGAVALTVPMLPAPDSSASNGVTFETIATIELPEGGAEIVTASPDGYRLAVSQSGGQSVVTLLLGKSPIVQQIDVSAFGEPTSVAFADNRTVLIAVKDDPNPGYLVVADIITGEIVSSIQIGIGPDSIAVALRRNLAVVAIEDEEEEVDDPTNPPPNIRPGSVQIVDFSQGFAENQLVVTSIPISLAGLPGVLMQNDPQPEYVAIDRAQSRAYVTVQENGAIAVINLFSKSVERVFATGITTHLADLTNNGTFSVTEMMAGRREPDGIAVSPDGRFLFTADEGDTSSEEPTDDDWSGGRTMSVFNAQTGALVTDTGSAIETAVIGAGLLNDGRSDDRGPEPENVVVFGTPFGRQIAAVALERSDAVIFFDVTNPTTPTFCGIVPVGDRPEGLVYLSNRNQLVVANEDDGTLSIVRVRG